MNRKKIFYIFCMIAGSVMVFSADAKTYYVKTDKEVNALRPLPGDSVVMQGTGWSNARLTFKGNGTESQPIVLMAKQPGKLVLSGNSNLKIDGQWLIVNGLFFTNGYSSEGDVIVFSKTASHCRLTNTAVVNYNPPDKSIDYKWVSLYGAYNKVDHCEFTGKAHQGTTLVVWLSDKPNHHVIEYNYFGPRPPLGANGGESIRIGTSEWSMHDSYTTVQKNIFDKCDGETEIISVKSCRNLIADNLFYECDGTLTLRHGNDNRVSGNYFIGNNRANTGGIRVIGEGHVIKNNYLYALTGDDLRAAISVMNAFENPRLNEYWQVKNAVIENNYIVQCKSAFVIGSGKNDKRVVAPDSITIRNNYVISPKALITIRDRPAVFVVNGNKVLPAPVADGFTVMKSNALKVNKYGVWVLPENKEAPFWITENTGADWSAKKKKFRID